VDRLVYYEEFNEARYARARKRNQGVAAGEEKQLGADAPQWKDLGQEILNRE
jgi:hypothetical protein